MSNNPSLRITTTATTTLSKRSYRRSFFTFRKMFQLRKKAKFLKRQKQRQNNSAPAPATAAAFGKLQQTPYQLEPIEQPSSDRRQQQQQNRVFSIRKKKNTKDENRYESPQRNSNMPREIKITPGTPDSAFSAVSGATGLHTTSEFQHLVGGRSMFKSVLPEMTSETEECSVDRSTYSWSSKVGKNSMSKGGNGTNSGNVKSTSAKKMSIRSTRFGKYMIGGSSNSVISDDTDDPSRKLFAKSPAKGKAKREKKSYLANSKIFKNIVNYTFDSIDIDKSGTIDKKEIYSGLLLIHLKLAAYVGPAACRPASKEYVFEMFDILDTSKDGTLDRDEFTTLMTVLCSQITTKLFVQMLMTILIVPFVSQHLVDMVKHLFHIISAILAEIDDAEVVSEFLWGLVLRGWDFVLLLTPPLLQSSAQSIYESLSEGFLDTMPLTIMSCLLGCMIVPWLLYQCDEFYSRIAVKQSSIVQT